MTRKVYHIPGLGFISYGPAEITDAMNGTYTMFRLFGTDNGNFGSCTNDAQAKASLQQHARVYVKSRVEQLRRELADAEASLAALPHCDPHSLDQFEVTE